MRTWILLLYPSLKVDFLMSHENFCENNYILSLYGIKKRSGSG